MADKAGGKSKSAQYYAKNPKAKAKKAAYDKKYHSTPARKKYRADLNKKNREAGTYGNGDGKDVSHKKGGGTTSEARSKNRARQGAGGKAKKK